MANIAIYREAKVGKISSYHHLVCQQDFSNQDEKNNPNKGKSNLMFYIENGEYKYQEFYRDGTNQDLMESLKTKELELDKFARADYKAHKTKEKLENPDKKVRTVLQSKNLKKEFVLAIGGDQDITPSDFANKVTKTVDAVLKEKGLNRENIIGVFVHRDEMGAIHGHVIFNEYSVLHKTTANQLGKPTIPAGATKKQISDIVKKHHEDFGRFQDIVADAMGMQRGEKGSKAKHLSKAQHFEKQSKEVEQLERITAKLQKTKEKLQDEIKKTQDMNVLINAGRDKAKREMEEFQELSTKNQKAIITQERQLKALETAKMAVSTPLYQLPEDDLIKAVVFITGKPKQEAIEIFSEAFDRVKCPGSKTFNQIAEKAHKDKFKLNSQYENEHENDFQNQR
jgi:hypothetical protein